MIKNEYIRKEIGNRREITSSMIARAEGKEQRDSTQQLCDIMKASLKQQQPAPLYSIFGGFFGASVGGILPTRCPYCGK
jgi:hypothetical protein